MKYAFFGSPDFAAIILEKLIKAGMPPALVVCNPDRPAGRKKVLTPPVTKIVAQKNNIKVWQPEKLSASGGELGELDFAVVAAYSKILPAEIIKIPRLGTIGVHPSLLPKYRGATPIQTAILEGEKETGTTIFMIDEKVDHGAILAAKAEPITTGDTYETLLKKLAEASGDLLVEVLPKFLKGEVGPQAQNEALATYTKKFKTEDGFVEPEDLKSTESSEDPAKAELVLLKIKALNPEPGVYTFKDGKRVKLLEAEIAGGKLKLRVIQYEGKKPINLRNGLFLG